ncbi:hypothetical protein AgCh_000326 [Apium graveolens]
MEKDLSNFHDIRDLSGDERNDKEALSAIYQAIPEDILLSVAEKKTSKGAWNAIKVMCLGAERVRKAKVQTLKTGFENLSMKETETLDEFCLRLSGSVTNMRILGETVEESYVVKKLLRVVPARFLQITSAMEQFGKIDEMWLKETIGSLKAYEERTQVPTERATGQLMMTEEEWNKREKNDDKQLLLTREEWLQRSNKGTMDGNQFGRNRSGGGFAGTGGRFNRDKSRVKCFNCHGYGHFAATCKRPKGEKEPKSEANLVQVQGDEPTLLFTEASESKESTLLLNERYVVLKLNKNVEERGVSDIWYLDNGASNHMTGELSKFKEMNEQVTGRVKFGDGSTVEIRGHVNFQSMKLLSERAMVYGVPKFVKPEGVYTRCLLSKQSRKPFPKQTMFHAKQALELIHADLCGPISPATIGGNKYFLLLVDDYSKMMWVYMLSNKDEAFGAFKKFKVLVDKESEKEIKVLRTDRGGEFCSKEFQSYCEENGIGRHYTAPYTHQQNGVVKRRNRTVVAMAQSFLKEKNMPSNLWGEAVRHSIYVLNHLPTRALSGVTPHEAWTSTKPDLRNQRTFGCIAQMKIPSVQTTKLDDRNSRKLQVSQDVTFEESRTWDWDKFGEIQNATYESFTVLENQWFEDSATESTQEPVTPITSVTRSTERSLTPGESSDTEENSGPRRFRLLEEIYDETEEVEIEYELLLLGVDEPLNYSQAARKKEWEDAMKVEIDAIEKNNTWKLVELPSGQKPIKLKWVYKLKRDRNGEVVKHKARLVARGAPGLVLDSKLRKCLEQLGFEKCPYEHAVYTRREGDGALIITVYIDDILITGTKVSNIVRFKQQMAQEFEMSDLGMLSYYLGIEVSQEKDRIVLKQIAYAQKLLEKAGMGDCNLSKYPMEVKVQLDKDENGKGNYTAWALKMKVYMQAHGVWIAIESDDPKLPIEDWTDKIALAAIYQGIPEDVLLFIAEKKTAKEAWDAVKTMCLGADRVKTARIQTLKAEFETLSMKDTESLDDFCMKLNGLVTTIRALGEEVKEAYIVKKLLRAVPTKFLQIASTIEQFGDLETMTVEETVGSLKAHEERLRGQVEPSGGQLLLTEEEWSKRERDDTKLLLTREEWLKRLGKGDGSSGSKFRRDFGRGGRDKTKVRCFNCQGYGHYAADCKKSRRERENKEQKEEVNMTQMQDDEPALLMVENNEEGEKVMLINEEQVVPKLNHNVKTMQPASNLWYLDNGASNHMTGQLSKFREIDENVKGKVRFGDGSTVSIKGNGIILLKCKNGEERLLKDVYYIPMLCNNIISLGQLTEEGNRVILSGVHLWIYDKGGRLIMKVKNVCCHGVMKWLGFGMLDLDMSISMP